MKSEKRVFKLSRSQWIGIAVVGSSLGVAMAVPLTTFTAGTQISASAVNANFAALNNALPQVWGSTDATSAGVTVPTTTLPQTTNTLSINVPAAGHLIVSGSVYINNGMATALFYHVNPQIDGTALHGAVGVAANATAAAFLSADTQGGDSATLAYTITVPITAGTHTVSQQVAPTALGGTSVASATYFYNRNFLTVVFIPQLSGFVTASKIEAPSTSLTPGGVNGPFD